MKSLFKKYYHSVLRPDEFSEVSDYLSDKMKESIIYGLMKPFWDKEMNETDVTPCANPVLFEKIREAIWKNRHQAAQKKIKMYNWAMSAVAVLVVALLLSNIFFYKKSDSNQLTSQLQTITTPYGAKTNITLPDGSSVWLNSGSTLSYPLKFGKSRSVTLVGEAFFEVEKDKKPFIVSAKEGDVVVKGTAFNVKAYADDNKYEATLVEGVIAFNTKNAKNGVTLKPGEQVAKTSKGFTIKQVETKYFTSWKEGKLLFKKEPFPSFMKKLERWYNVKIQYSDSELDKLWYTGTIEMETISEVMEMISKSAPVTYSFNNKTRVFTINAK